MFPGGQFLPGRHVVTQTSLTLFLCLGRGHLQRNERYITLRLGMTNQEGFSRVEWQAKIFQDHEHLVLVQTNEHAMDLESCDDKTKAEMGDICSDIVTL